MHLWGVQDPAQFRDMRLGHGHQFDELALQHPATLALAILVPSTEIQQQHERDGGEQREDDEQAGGGEELHIFHPGRPDTRARPPTVPFLGPTGG
ncbi:MAG: hypothetical protein ACRDSK_15010 [Actinophytocola sp.]|uniref:hypothetical protein n=1 Tax=Actinophytocola sp. TaxID=1872138 RepID=UPI003D6BFF09